MKKEKRDKHLTDGFLSQGFDYNGVHYKPLTAQSLLILQKVNSPIYTGERTDELWLQVVLEYMYVTSKPVKEILKATENWEETILEYADNFQQSDLIKIGEIINSVLEQTSSAIVETRGDEDTEKK